MHCTSQILLFSTEFFLSTALTAGIDKWLKSNMSHYSALGSRAISIKVHFLHHDRLLNVEHSTQSILLPWTTILVSAVAALLHAVMACSLFVSWVEGTPLLIRLKVKGNLVVMW